jgi:hypothetical protein
VKPLPKLIEKVTNRITLKKPKIRFFGSIRSSVWTRQPEGVKCPAIGGFLSEADEVAGEVADKEGSMLLVLLPRTPSSTMRPRATKRGLHGQSRWVATTLLDWQRLLDTTPALSPCATIRRCTPAVQRGAQTHKKPSRGRLFLGRLLDQSRM